MSILKLTPACKDYLWGGTKLITDYGKRYDGARLAETWELSGHPDGSGPCSRPVPTRQIARGLSRRAPRGAGEHGRKFAELPVLIKLIDAAKDLSIQVHPTTPTPRARGTERQKRRCGMSSPPSRTPVSTAAFRAYFPGRAKAPHRGQRASRGPAPRERQGGRHSVHPRGHHPRHLPRHRGGRGAAEQQRDLPRVRLRPPRSRRKAPRPAHRAGAGRDAPDRRRSHAGLRRTPCPLRLFHCRSARRAAGDAVRYGVIASRF